MALEADPARSFRNSGDWRRVRGAVMAKAKREGSPCWICGEPILWDVGKLHPRSATVDHLRSLRTLDLASAEGRRIALDPGLLQIAHRCCNTARANSSRAREGGSRARRVVSPAPRRRRRRKAFASTDVRVSASPADLVELEAKFAATPVPVCGGSACRCAWMGDGKPREGCPDGPPEFVTLKLGPTGWTPAGKVSGDS